MREVNLDYQLFLQRESRFRHRTYEKEMEFYNAIQKGDMKFIDQCQKMMRGGKIAFQEGRGILSKSPVKNVRYHFIIDSAIIARKCTEHGLMQEAAYTLSDMYIRMADEVKTIREIGEIYWEMVRQFTQKMNELRFQHISSSHISKCVVYIYEHLHEQITIEKLAQVVQLTPTYLAFLFKKEMGITIHRFIQEKRLETAENLLRQSDYSYLEIANSLRFSSQSHFIKSFKEKYALTPKEYRMQHHYKYAALPSSPSKAERE